MRFSTIAAFATSLAVVSAQAPDLSSIPDCAVACLVAAIPTSGCGVTDVTCQCTTGQASITSSLEDCIPIRCSADDVAKVPSALAGICAAAGITVSIPSSIAAATSAAASAANSAAASASAAVSSAASSAHSAASAASTRVASATGSASTSAPAQSTGGAVANAAGLGAVMLGVFVAAF